jgi:hypothetical protein
MVREKTVGQIAVRLDAGTLAGLESMADSEERTLSMMARILIREALAAREAAKLTPMAGNTAKGKKGRAEK